MRRYPFAAVLMLALALPGCSSGCWKSVLPVITKIITSVVDAEHKLDYIEKGIDAYFKDHPDPDAEARVRKAMAKVRSSLNVAARLANAAHNTGEANYDQAFEDFRQMWKELMILLKSLNVVSADGVLAAGPHAGLVIDEPLAVKGETP